MRIWVQYDQSPERLILNVADSAEELAEITGATYSTIYSTASRVKNGKIKNGQYAVVEVSDLDQED